MAAKTKSPGCIGSRTAESHGAKKMEEPRRYFFFAAA
jgi:hypothetical protein